MSKFIQINNEFINRDCIVSVSNRGVVEGKFFRCDLESPETQCIRGDYQEAICEGCKHNESVCFAEGRIIITVNVPDNCRSSVRQNMEKIIIRYNQCDDKEHELDNKEINYLGKTVIAMRERFNVLMKELNDNVE